MGGGGRRGPRNGNLSIGLYFHSHFLKRIQAIHNLILTIWENTLIESVSTCIVFSTCIKDDKKFSLFPPHFSYSTGLVSMSPPTRGACK